MVNHLKSLIITQIKDVFNDIKVYDEIIKQGLAIPSFQILIIENAGHREFGRLYSKFITFNINYFPVTEDVRTECDAVLETFQENFKYIQDKYHVHDINGAVNDDVLVITFDVEVRTIEEIEGTKMQELGGVAVDKKD